MSKSIWIVSYNKSPLISFYKKDCAKTWIEGYASKRALKSEFETVHGIKQHIKLHKIRLEDLNERK